MFKKGEIVVYSTTGVCIIEDLCEKQFGSFSAQYYVLKPLMQKKATVFVPVNNPSLTKKMRTVLTKKCLEQALSSATLREVSMVETENERKKRFEDILESGDRLSLVNMVWELYFLKKKQLENGRRLHLADERLLDCAENLLFDEIAYVYGIDLLDAEKIVTDILQV